MQGQLIIALGLVSCLCLCYIAWRQYDKAGIYPAKQDDWLFILNVNEGRKHMSVRCLPILSFQFVGAYCIPITNDYLVNKQLIYRKPGRTPETEQYAWVRDDMVFTPLGTIGDSLSGFVEKYRAQGYHVFIGNVPAQYRPFLNNKPLIDTLAPVPYPKQDDTVAE